MDEFKSLIKINMVGGCIENWGLYLSGIQVIGYWDLFKFCVRFRLGENKAKLEDYH